MCISLHFTAVCRIRHKPDTTQPGPLYTLQSCMRLSLEGYGHDLYSTLAFVELVTYVVHGLVLYAQSLFEPL